MVSKTSAAFSFYYQQFWMSDAVKGLPKTVDCHGVLVKIIQ